MLYYITEQDGKATYHDEVEQVSFTIPKEDLIGLISGQKVPALKGDAFCRDAIANPIHCQTLSELVKQKHAKSASIIVSDGTRGVPTRSVSGIILDELAAAGIPYEKVLIIVGTGLHRPATEAEYRTLVDEKYYGKVRMISSNAFAPEEFVTVGTSSRGTPIDVNREAYECDLHISIGKAEIHGMAGFSGGRKSVLPGISSYRTILQNHTPQMITDPHTKRGVLEENPFHLEMLEAARMYGIDFCVTFVMNEENQIAGIFAGDLNDSHVAACTFIQSYANVKLPEKPDIFVVTTGAPFNVNFYQASRAMRMLDNCIDENTVVAFYAGCPEGILSDQMLLPFENGRNLEEAEAWMWEHWEPRMDDTLFHMKTLKTGAKFLCYSPGVKREDFETLQCFGADSYEDFLKRAYALSGKAHPRVAFYPMLHKYFTTL